VLPVLWVIPDVRYHRYQLLYSISDTRTPEVGNPCQPLCWQIEIEYINSEEFYSSKPLLRFTYLIAIFTDGTSATPVQQDIVLSGS